MIAQIIQLGGAAFIGVIGTLSGLFLKSELDRLKERRTRRALLVDCWREAVKETWPLSNGTALVAGGGMPITKSEAWVSLRGHLPEAIRRSIEGTPAKFGGSTFRVTVGGDGPLRNELLDAIDQIERRWGLI